MGVEECLYIDGIFYLIININNMSLVNNNNNMEDNDQQNKTFRACREHTSVTFLHLIEGQTFE